MNFAFLDELKYNADGLIPCVAQDADNGEVLMVAYMNRDALKATVESGKAQYWSRSRQKFWVKGESSGHTQAVQEIRFDCDKDCVLLKVKQNVAACHVGYRSCFYNKLTAEGTLVEDGDKVFDPDKVYS